MPLWLLLDKRADRSERGGGQADGQTGAGTLGEQADRGRQRADRLRGRVDRSGQGGGGAEGQTIGRADKGEWC